MLQVLILICAQNMTAAECQMNTALDIVSGPQVASVAACAMQSQALLAQGTLLRNKGEYAKFRCTPRDRIVKTALTRH